LHKYPTEKKKEEKKTKFPQGIVESGKNAPGNHHLSKKQNLFFHREVQQRNVKGRQISFIFDV
jgi:hypothetical protein